MGREGSMPRGKGGPPTRATVTPREYHERFAKRKDGLRNKCEQLATLCAVDVAVVCTGPGGAGEPDCWPSKERANEVARRYGALPDAQRAKHTEDIAGDVARRVAEGREKLARAREGGVACALGSWDGSLVGVPEERLRELLGSIEGSVVAVKSRALKLQAPPLGGAADRAKLLPGLVHKDEATEEDSVSAADKGTKPARDEAGAGGGGGGLGPPPGKNPNSPNAVPVDADKVVVAAGDAGAEVQILQQPGDADADADDAEWMRGLVDDLKKGPRPYNPAAYAAEVKYIKVGRFVMERDAYDFIRFDLGMPPPCVAPNPPPSPDDDGEPLKLWSWDNTMPSY